MTDYTIFGSYEYKCFFEAGDTINYLARSGDGFKTFNRMNYFVNYPWRAIASYDYDEESVKGAKYGTPQPDASNSIVGKWKGSCIDNLLARGVTYNTWVFRSDQRVTCYLMVSSSFLLPIR